MSSFTLKILAAISMLIDHIGAVFYPTNLLTSPNSIWRIIGRISFPIFAFQLGIGYKNTKSKEKHILTMLIFAIVSQLPFKLAFQTERLNIGFTFLISLLIIYTIEKIKNKIIKMSILIPLFYTATSLETDYGIYGIALCTALYYSQSSKILTFSTLFSFILLNATISKNPLSLFALISIIPILLYNQKQGPKLKLLFYVFYPLHIITLYMIKIFI